MFVGGGAECFEIESFRTSDPSCPQSQPEWLKVFPVVRIVPGDLLAVRLAGAWGYEIGRVLRKPTAQVPASAVNGVSMRCIYAGCVCVCVCTRAVCAHARACVFMFFWGGGGGMC